MNLMEQEEVEVVVKEELKPQFFNLKAIFFVFPLKFFFLPLHTRALSFSSHLRSFTLESRAEVEMAGR
jgi:hypothetical protein